MAKANLDEFVKLGAAWVNRDSSGRVFMSTDLHLAGRKVILFKNRFKEPGSSKPDFELFLAPLPEDKRGGGDLLADSNGLEAYDDDLGDIPVGAGESVAPMGAGFDQQTRQARATRPATAQANRAYQGNQRPAREPYQPQRVANVPGGTNAALGGRGHAVRNAQGNAAEASMGEDDLADPFAE